MAGAGRLDERWRVALSIPYYILDGAAYKAEVAPNPDEASLRVTSPEDRRTGVQLVRTFHVYAGTTRSRWTR